MNLKIAAMLIVSVFMSANTSYGGDLLDRMLGRTGCSSCAAPAVKSCGCGGGGLLDKLLSCGRSSCSNAGILSVDSAAGCGCQAAAPSCGCNSAPAPAASSCGCDAAPACGSDGLFARLRKMGSGCGCNSAPAPAVSSCGCDAAPACGSSGLFDRLSKMGSGCGCNSAPAPAVSSCGCDAAPACGSSGLFDRLGKMGSGCGCNSAPAPAVSSCGCDAAPACGSNGLFDRLGKMGSGCGCNSAPAVEASSCGCNSAPVAQATSYGFDASPAMVDPFAGGSCGSEGGCGSGGGFLSRLKGMGKGLSCNSAPAASACGCDAAPAVEASSCGFTAVSASSCGASVGSRLFGQRGCGSASAISSGCGCDAAPAVATCGCDAPAGGCGTGSGRPKLTLLDRLRGNRIARDSNGRVLGVSNDGCNPPCPVAPSAGCGCNSNSYAEAPYVVEAAPYGGCSSCGGGEVIYSDAMPYNSNSGGCASGACGSTPTYGEAIALPAAAAALDGSESNVDPVVPAATEGTLQEVEDLDAERRDITQPSVSDEENDPIVDPGAFIRRPTNSMGS